MILLGYHATGGYKLFNPVTKEVLVSRDVVVDESKDWNWDKEMVEEPTKVVIEASIDEPSDSSAVVIDDSDQGGVRKSQRARQVSSRLLD